MSQQLLIAIENDELRKRLKSAEKALDVAHRVMFYRNWNMREHPSLERDAFDAADAYRRENPDAFR